MNISKGVGAVCREAAQASQVWIHQRLRRESGASGKERLHQRKRGARSSINNQEEEKRGYEERLHQLRHGARLSIINQEERNLTNHMILPFMKTLRFIDNTAVCEVYISLYWVVEDGTEWLLSSIGWVGMIHFGKHVGKG